MERVKRSRGGAWCVVQGGAVCRDKKNNKTELQVSTTTRSKARLYDWTAMVGVHIQRDSNGGCAYRQGMVGDAPRVCV